MTTPGAPEPPERPGSSTTVTVSYFGNMKRRMGLSEEEVVFDDGPVTVRDLLVRLAGRHGDDVTELFYNQYGWLDPRCLIFIEDEALTQVEGLEADLTGVTGVRLTLALPITGG